MPQNRRNAVVCTNVKKIYLLHSLHGQFNGVQNVILFLNS